MDAIPCCFQSKAQILIRAGCCSVLVMSDPISARLLFDVHEACSQLALIFSLKRKMLLLVKSLHNIVESDGKCEADRFCKPNRDYCHPSCMQIPLFLITATVYTVPLTLPDSYHTMKANGSACLFYTNLQLQVLLPDMKERLLCVSALFQ